MARMKATERVLNEVQELDQQITTTRPPTQQTANLP